MRRLIALSLLLGTGAAAPARAAVVDVVTTGRVTIGSDVAGDFFAAGTSLAGKTLTVTYRFDTASVALDSIGPGSLDYSGGTLFGDASPAVSATISFTGSRTPVTFAGNDYGVLAEQSNASYSFQSHEASAVSGPYVYSSVTAGPGALPAGLLQAYSYSVRGGDNAVGYFDLNDGTFASFLPTELRETVISAVPLPPALPLFAVALVAIGVGGRWVGRQSSAVKSG